MKKVEFVEVKGINASGEVRILKVFSKLQAFVTINQLNSDGYSEIYVDFDKLDNLVI